MKIDRFYLSFLVYSDLVSIGNLLWFLTELVDESSIKHLPAKEREKF